MNKNQFIHKGNGDQIAGDKVGRDKIRTQINNNPELAQTLEDFKALIEKFSEEYNPNTEKGQNLIQGEIVETLQQNPTLRKRIIAMLQAMGETTLDELIDHPAAKISIAGVKGFITGEAG
ncbi:MAG: hypothetical protein F6K03_05630 [Kamptonema sp. SIO4C4]|nr:hypothetical protein [Kamptonema sp. SIO4C4]